MSLAEDLLNTLNDGGANDNTESNDVEEPIIVDETRRIIVPNKLKTIAVTGDKNVETVTFKCIRYWDVVHDLSNFVIYINYILPNGTTGTYIPEIKEIFDDYFTFDWLIGREITKYNGSLTFLILARRTDNEGKLEYQWSSLLNSECTIAQGLDIINVTDDEEAEDRLTSLLEKYEQLSKLPDEVNKKLTQDTSVTDKSKAYIKAPDGTQTTVNIASAGIPNAIMALNENRQTKVGTPTEDDHIANKKYVDNGLSTKLKLNTTATDKSQVYVKRNDGTQQMLDLSSGAEPFSVVFVGANGRYSAQYPINVGDVANKKYVDTELAKFDFIKVANVLPKEGLPNKIYLVPKSDTQNQDLFDEWVWINKGTEEEPNFDWEWVTTKQLEVDLTPYVKKDEVDEFLALPLETGEGENSLIINEGNANGDNSIAGGTTDINLIKSVLGDGYVELLDDYNLESLLTLLQPLWNSLNTGYTFEEFKRLIQISPSAAEGLLAISLGASNKSKSTAGISLGYGNISGAKGYYIGDIEPGDRMIYLSTKQDTTERPSKTPDWQVGDRLFIVNGDRCWAKISSTTLLSSQGIVKLEEMPFSKLAELKKYLTYNLTNPTERSVINIDKPESGEVDIGWGAIGIGALNTILGSNAFGVGYKNLIAGDFGASFGQENEVGYSAFAAGILNKALGKASATFGSQNTASGTDSVAVGSNTYAKERGSFSQGQKTEALKEFAIATGEKTTALGRDSFSAGASTNIFANVGGNDSLSDYAIIELWKKNLFSLAKGYCSSVRGIDCLALANFSDAKGYKTIAKGWAASSAGQYTEANAERSYAGGHLSIANHTNSFVHGRNLSSSRNSQAVFGEDSIANPDAYLIVGTSESIGGNAFEVLEDGTMVGKKLKLGNTEISEEQLNKLLDLLEPKTIKFTYNGDEFYAYDGMTWREFCESSLNHDIGFGISGAGKLLDWNGMDIGLNGTIVNPDDVIIEDGSYEEYI